MQLRAEFLHIICHPFRQNKTDEASSTNDELDTTCNSACLARLEFSEEGNPGQEQDDYLSLRY